MWINRRSSIVAVTGWTFADLDEQDTQDVNAHLEWLRIRSAVQKQYEAKRRN